MSKTVDLHRQIGRRLRLRDLHLFQEVVQRGSMSRAASHLGMSQPAVSEAIADLEHTLGVQLFDRKAQGVEPTTYGHALFKRSLAVFDELKQGLKDIEFLSDPTSGELRIGAVVAPAATILPVMIYEFSKRYPKVVLHIDEVPSPARELIGLHDRKYDLILGRNVTPLPSEGEGLNIEYLHDEPHVIAAGCHTQWARRRKIDPTELLTERWILGAPNTWNYQLVAEAFRARGLEMPPASVVSVSVHLRAYLLANGPFISLMPESVARRYSLKVLPVDLPLPSYPVVIFTLKNRNPPPVARVFIDCARDVARRLAAK